MTGSRVGWTTGSAPAAMKSAPVQKACSDDVAGVSWGLAAVASAVQKTEAGSTGWMIPVTTICTGPACRRVPTRRPNLAAVLAVTAACTTPVAEPPPGVGRCPATTWLYRVSAVR